MKRLPVLLGLAVLVQLSPLPNTSAQADARYFPQTGKTLSGRFLAYWNTHGGLAQQGYPVSDTLAEKSDVDGKVYTVQYFERAVFEAHPENPAPYDVLLSLLGTLHYQERYPSGAPGQAPNNAPGSWFFPETGKRLGGPFLDYWTRHGGLAQQGYPISDEFNEVSSLDGKQYRVQYFERAVFEYHPENAGTQYDVLLSLLGTLLYEERYPSGASGQAPNNTPGSRFFPETGKRLGGPFLDYWTRHGGLAQQGYPISDEFNEVSSLDGKQYRVQYFERAVFEYHPENAGTQYEVLLSQLGTHRLRSRQVESSQAVTPDLPPVPRGIPGHMSMGLLNEHTSEIPLAPSVPLDYRYKYLAGGVSTKETGTGKGWATWNSPAGRYIDYYVEESNARDLSTAFVYYQILQSAPHYNEYANLNDPSVMRAYFDDFKLLMQKLASSNAKGRVPVNIEPDLNGVMQQHPTNKADDASLQRASVASSGHPDAQGFPDTFRGFYQTLAHIRDLYAPDVLLGLDVSQWATGHDVAVSLRDDPAYDWSAHALRIAKYLNSLGSPAQFELLFYSPLDRDAAYYQAQRGINVWWHDTNAKEPSFSTMGAWLGKIVSATGRRAMLWQVPNGNRVYRTMNNTDGHWQDNRPEYFLNPESGRAHLAEWANLGVVGILWGAGTGDQSHYHDYHNDGITNPPPINGNTAVSSHPDDDGGYLRLRLTDYYASTPLPLPGAGARP
ncbi:MAG TPA: hypothetical protein VFR15_03915 [Chloroflexia bacterium]|nr:hypothetical protein [Chloroflexia bacterium]